MWNSIVLCVCVVVCVCVCVYVYVCVRYVCVCVCVYVCVFAFIYACVFVLNQYIDAYMLVSVRVDHVFVLFSGYMSLCGMEQTLKTKHA